MSPGAAALLLNFAAGSTRCPVHDERGCGAGGLTSASDRRWACGAQPGELLCEMSSGQAEGRRAYAGAVAIGVARSMGKPSAADLR